MKNYKVLCPCCFTCQPPLSCPWAFPSHPTQLQSSLLIFPVPFLKPFLLCSSTLHPFSPSPLCLCLPSYFVQSTLAHSPSHAKLDLLPHPHIKLLSSFFTYCPLIKPPSPVLQTLSCPCFHYPMPSAPFFATPFIPIFPFTLHPPSTQTTPTFISPRLFRSLPLPTHSVIIFILTPFFNSSLHRDHIRSHAVATFAVII